MQGLGDLEVTSVQINEKMVFLWLRFLGNCKNCVGQGCL